MKEEREVTTRDFSAYGRPLEMVSSFRYLRQVISEADDNWKAGGEELVLGEGGLGEYDAHPQQGGGGAAGVWLYFNAVVQAVLLFGSRTWVVTPRMVKALRSFRPRWRDV